jgi:hypothetical protein
MRFAIEDTLHDDLIVQESVATLLPALEGSEQCLLFLECWRGIKPVGNQIEIDLAKSRLLAGKCH